MDKIILGILMLKRLTSYEIRNLIRQSYKSMCSDSLGTIQATLKKLLTSGLVTCNEFVERGVNKKVYSITDAGRTLFMEWLKTPMDMTKGKNMELGKFLLMGLVPAEKRRSLIDESIAMLNNELSYLQEIQKNLNTIEGKKKFIFDLEQDPEYALGIKNATGSAGIIENAEDICKFEVLTLQFGIDSMKFQIKWFQDLEKKLKAETRIKQE